MESVKPETARFPGGASRNGCLAAALAPEPKYSCLMSPSALDYKLRKEMQIEMKRLQNEKGITFIFVTQTRKASPVRPHCGYVERQVLQVGHPRNLRRGGAFCGHFMEDKFLEEKLFVGEGPAKVALDAGETIRRALLKVVAPCGK